MRSAAAAADEGRITLHDLVRNGIEAVRAVKYSGKDSKQLKMRDFLSEVETQCNCSVYFDCLQFPYSACELLIREGYLDLAVRWFEGHYETVAGGLSAISRRSAISAPKAPDGKPALSAIRCVATGDSILHYVMAHRTYDDIKLFLQYCPEELHTVNTAGLTPLSVFIRQQQPSLQDLLLLVRALSIMFLKSSPLRLISLRDTLAMDSQASHRSVHLHLCGQGCAGKTTLKNSMFKGMGRNSWWKRHSPFRRREVDDISVESRTIGQEQHVVQIGDVQWVLHDYGGQDEFHINHPRFLAMPNSVYIVVVGVYDVTAKATLDMDTVTKKFTYWMRFLNSIVSAGVKVPVMVVVNEHPSVSKAVLKTVVDTVKGLQAAWSSKQHNKLTFVGEPLLTNAKNIDASRRLYDTQVKECFHLLAPPLIARTVVLSRMIDEHLPKLPAVMKYAVFNEVVETALLNTLNNGLPRDVVAYLCSKIETQLVNLGAIIAIDRIWVVTDVPWLTNQLLGGLMLRFFDEKSGKSLDCRILSLEQINESADAIRDQLFRDDASRTLIADLLVAVGLCIPDARNETMQDEGDKKWYPVFSQKAATPQQCALLPLDTSMYGRRVIRRFKLVDPETQMFPSGYFAKLFVTIAANYKGVWENILIYENAMEIQFITNSMTAQVMLRICDEERTMFELAVSCNSDLKDRAIRPSAAWSIFTEISTLVLVPPNWMQNVPIVQLFVNPAPNGKVITEELLSEKFHSADRKIVESGHVYLYGINQHNHSVDEGLSVVEIEEDHILKEILKNQERMLQESAESKKRDEDILRELTDSKRREEAMLKQQAESQRRIDQLLREQAEAKDRDEKLLKQQEESAQQQQDMLSKQDAAKATGDKALKLQEEAKRRGEDMLKHQVECNTRIVELMRRQDEAGLRLMELMRQQNEAKQREEELLREQAESKSREEELLREHAELARKQDELSGKQDASRRREDKILRKQEESKKREVDMLREQVRFKRRQEEVIREQSESARREQEILLEQENVRRRTEELQREQQELQRILAAFQKDQQLRGRVAENEARKRHDEVVARLKEWTEQKSDMVS